MIIAFCVDDRYGMLFHHRRQSKDALLRSRLLELSKGKRLWMNAYSAGQFDPADIQVSEDFLQRASGEDVCFVEDRDPNEWLSKCDGLILYSWNRKYPADLFFPEEALEGWTLTHTCEFAGSSHDKITERIYEKK